MIKYLYTILIILGLQTIYAQSADDYFAQSAYAYINSQTDQALERVNQGISQYPNNQKLQALKQKIEEQKDNEAGQDQQSQQQPSEDDSQQQSDPQDSQNQQGQQDGQDRGEQGAGSSDQETRENEGQQSEADKQENTSQESSRYDRMLEALSKQEQNTQKRLLMGESRQRLGRNQKDW